MSGAESVVVSRLEEGRAIFSSSADEDLHIRAKAEEFTGVNRRIFEGFHSMFDSLLDSWLDSWLAPAGEIEQVLTGRTQMNLTARVECHYTGD